MKKIIALVLALALVLSCCAALADAPAGYPSTSINLYIGFGAGGDTDLSNRLLATYMESKLGVSIAANNVKGSNGAVCMAQYQSTPNDGYTIIAANTNAVLSNYANGTSEFGYQDYEVIGIFCHTAGDMLFANKDSGITSIEDLKQACIDNPFEINLGCSFGGLTQAYAMLMEKAGLDINIVDGGDGANRIAYLVGDHVDVCFVPYANAKEYIETGDVVPLATIASSSTVVDVPSLKDAGLAETTFDGSYIWLAPKGTDSAIVEYLAECMQDIVLNDAQFNADQAAYTYNSEAFCLIGQDALDWLAAAQETANANAAVLK